MNPETKIPSRVAEINAEIARQGNKGYSVAPSAPTYTPPTTISNETLAPVTPIRVSTPTPLTGPDGLLGGVQSGAASFQTDLQQKTAQQQKIDELQAKTSLSKQSFLERAGYTTGEAAKTDAAYSQTVDPIEQELNAVNQEIFQEEQSLRRRQEALDKQPGTLEQKAQAAYDMKKESSKLQSDLYVKQLGLQGRYDSAKKIADRKIAVELEKDKRDLEILKFDYEENKELFTKEEQRQFEQDQNDRERALNAKEAKMKTFEDTRIALLKSAAEQNAPAEVRTAIANSQTTEEAIQAAGQYSGDVLERQAKQNNLYKSQLEIQKLKKELEPGTGGDAPLYNGLSSTTATAVRGVVSGFKSEPQLTNFATIQDGYNFTKQISDTTKNPADDQALIYSLAKALDPGSVVREGEYATAQKYAQSWIKSYGKGIEQAVAGTGFLSEEARKNIKQVIETKYKSSKVSYDNLYNQYSKQINNLTGRDDGTKFLRDYAVETSTNQTVSPEDDLLLKQFDL